MAAFISLFPFQSDPVLLDRLDKFRVVEAQALRFHDHTLKVPPEKALAFLVAGRTRLRQDRTDARLHNQEPFLDQGRDHLLGVFGFIPSSWLMTRTEGNPSPGCRAPEM